MEVLYLPECLFVLLLMHMLFCGAVVVNVVAVLGINFTAVSYWKIGWHWLVPSQSFMSKLWLLHKFRTTYRLKFSFFIVLEPIYAIFPKFSPPILLKLTRGIFQGMEKGPRVLTMPYLVSLLCFE